MASEEAIQLRGGDRLSDRLQASSHTSGVSQSPPAYEDEVRSSAVKSFTLPHGVPSFGDRPGQMTEEIHRTRSLQDINQLTLSRGTLGTYRTLPRLKERIQTMKERRPASSTFCLDLKHVWWPKITRKLEPVLNIELWESHIKQVEGHFGTAVASYFVLLRWLFYMNLTILVVWMLFVLIPQFVVEPSLAVEKAYLLNPCISPNISYQCPRNSTSMVYWAMKNCTARTKGFTEARSCVRNQSDMTLVPTVPLGVNNKSCPHYPSPYRFCTIQQPSYDLISLVTGRDGYNDTWLFLGHYVNMTVPYNRPVAYLVCTAVVYGISFFMLVISIGKAYVNNTVKFSSLVKANFCNKVFAAWDYKLRNSRAVKLKKAFIKIDLQEELVEHQKQSKARSSKDLLKIVLIRTVTNLIVLALMVGCGAAIIAATANSWKQLVAQKLNAIGLIVPILIIASIIILPIIFHVIAGFEQYKTQSGHEKMTLIRSSFVRISTLLIYIIAAFSAIECTQSKDIQLAALNTFKNNTTYCLGSCWETFIGQQFYNLQILEFLFIAIFTIVYESGRHGLYRAFHKRVQHKILKSILSRASFSISDSVNDLVYYQLLMWLGFFFSPVLPLFQVVILFATFYIKKYSLMFNLEPDKEALFRGSRASVVSTVLFLLVLAGAVFPVGFAVSRFRPSLECGPFRTKESFLSVISEVIGDSSSSSQQFIYYIASSGFIVPFIMVLIAIICILSAVVVAKKKLLRLSIAHLDAEGIALLHTDEAALPMLAQLRHQSSAAQMAAVNTAAIENKTYVYMP